MANDEIYRDGAFVVTRTQIRTSTATYAVRNISSVRIGKEAGSIFFGGSMLIIGLLIGVIGFAAASQQSDGSPLWWAAIGAVVATPGLILAAKAKPTYRLIIVTNSGDAAAMSSDSAAPIMRAMDAVQAALAGDG